MLTLQTTGTTINQGQSVTFSGSVDPDETGRNVYLERLNAAGNQWHIIAIGRRRPQLAVLALVAVL